MSGIWETTGSIQPRITGYYRRSRTGTMERPRNSRTGKVYAYQQFKLQVKAKAEEHIDRSIKAGSPRAKRLLFTTKTCPNCVMAKTMLEKANIDYEIVDAEEHADLVEKYGVKQAPTLIVIEEGKVEKLANASNIKKYTESN